MRDGPRIVVIGAGPCGLGAAHRLEELGHESFVVLEAEDDPGGLARSFRDAQGFTWDVGGHVQFSHYEAYDRALARTYGQGWLYHERESWVWIDGRFVPYPLQYNLHRLRPEQCERALRGVERAARARNGRVAPRHFGDWVDQTFGGPLRDLFFEPYNEKVWGYPLSRLGIEWMGERVAVPDVERIRENVALGRDDVSWGPNATFRFPRRGGTGAIWQAVAGSLDADRLLFGKAVVSVDLAGRSVTCADGSRHAYDRLITSMPLDELLVRATGLADETHELGHALTYSSVHVLGVGLRGPRPESLARKCWMYFPEPRSPYYRVTVFSNYSPDHVPSGDCWSLMAEVCESRFRAAAPDLPAQVVAAMRRDRLIGEATEVVSLWHRREEHGYPTPFVGRDRVLDSIAAALEARDVYSRGRFGAWRYEVSNQDHAFMQGVEVVDRLLRGEPEITLREPDRVNAPRGREEAPRARPGQHP